MTLIGIMCVPMTKNELFKANFVCVITFEKNKLPLTVLIHSIDFGRQAFPEVFDLHWVSRDHWVVSYPPKPLVLHRHQRQRIIILISTIPAPCFTCFKTSWKLMISSTLKTKSSCRRMARVLKPPSQMLGLELGLEGLAPWGGRWGLAGRSCLRGSEGGWKRGGGAVGGGLVGWGALSGGPEKTETFLLSSSHTLPSSGALPLCVWVSLFVRSIHSWNFAQWNIT